MASRRPKKLADKSTRVKAIARTRIGSPKPARILEERLIRDKPKHKENWEDEAPES
ncbi:MAG: hypothetical protein JO319_19780 [Acidobacteriaceae bacterium]|nr:hypothetical protein [Acidobacteriaceae bacterium]